MDVSVLLSVYKGEQPAYLRCALDSILQQTFPPQEIVLMEDGPLTDELTHTIAQYLDDSSLVVELTPQDTTESILAKRASLLSPTASSHAASHPAPHAPRFVIGRISENVMLGRALAMGVALCNNELVARMDTDDIALPNRLALQHDFFEAHPETTVLGGAIEEFNDEGTLCRTKTIPGGKELRKYAKYRCPVNHMTVMFRRDDILRVGNYHHFPGLEDYELWSRALAHDCIFDNLPQTLVRARCNNDFSAKRGSRAYGNRYLTLRKWQREWGLLSFTEYLIALFATVVMVYSPAGLRSFLYTILRKERITS